jgi:hypothetical protein
VASPWVFEREHYRIEYPILERPTFVVGTLVHQVVDCSESGIRYRLISEPPEAGTLVAGRLRFRRGSELMVEGEVLRIQDACAALRLKEPGIPLRIMLDEQRFLRKQYPNR